MKAAIFFERDGVLNLTRTQGNTQVIPTTMEQFQINPEAVTALGELKQAGFLLIATTNQPGISRGCLSRRELDWMHAALRRKLPLDDIFVCSHDDGDRCTCRKPGSGLFIEAAFKWHLDLERSFVVSDKWQDAHAARQVGAISLLLKSPWNGRGHYDFMAESLGDIVQKIHQLSSASCLLMHQV